MAFRPRIEATTALRMLFNRRPRLRPPTGGSWPLIPQSVRDARQELEHEFESDDWASQPDDQESSP
jgi:hypothetical protein